MSPDPASDRHVVELGFLEGIINELGLATQLVEASAELAYPTLLVELNPEGAPDAALAPRELAITFYPIADDQLEDTMLLQYYIALPAAFAGDGLERVRAWLPELNNKTALGHFGLTDDHQQLHFRYVQTLPVTTGVTREAVAEVVLLVAYTPLMFAAPLAGLAAATLTLAEARAQVAARLSG